MMAQQAAQQQAMMEQGQEPQAPQEDQQELPME